MAHEAGPARDLRRRLPGLREARDADADGLVMLVGAAFDEYPGCVLDLDDLDRDLLAPAASAAAAGARWWVLPGQDGRILATVGAGAPDATGTAELKRLYVGAGARRRGLGAELTSWVAAHAAGLGAVALELWSDTRFEDAHRLYERLGFVADGRRRELHDPSATTERRFVLTIEPRAPRRRLAWDGPHGRDDAVLVELPAGARLTGEVAGLRYELEVDEAWRARRVDVHRGGQRRRVTSDAAGRWWVDGRHRSDLDGARTADVEVTAATDTLAVRSPDVGEERLVVSIAADGLEVTRTRHRYEPVGQHRWLHRDLGEEIAVDPDGFVVTRGDRWRRA